jgi:hypothetical protein
MYCMLAARTSPLVAQSLRAKAPMGLAGAVKRFCTAQCNILNILLLGTYLLYRQTHINETVDLKAPGMKWGTVHSSKYSTLEIQVSTALLATAAFRLYRSPTLDAQVWDDQVLSGLHACFSALGFQNSLQCVGCLQLAMVLSFSQIFVLLMTLMTSVVGSLLEAMLCCHLGSLLQLCSLAFPTAVGLHTLPGRVWPCVPSVPRAMGLRSQQGGAL